MRSRRLRTVSTRREPDPAQITEYAELVSLTQHPAWPTFVRVIEEEIEGVKRTTAHNTLFAEGPINQVAILQSRGFIKGARYLLRVAAGAERNLEAALQKANHEEEAS